MRRQSRLTSHCGADRQAVPRRQGNVLVQGHAQPAEGATRCPHSASSFGLLAEVLRAAAGIPLCLPLWGHGGGPGVHAAHHKRGRHGPPGHVHAGRGGRLLRLCADAFWVSL